MSERVGAIKLGQSSGEVFLGRDLGHEREYSEDVAGSVDSEVRRLIEAAHDEAWEILMEYRQVLDDLALALLERETLNQEELAEVFIPVTKREPRPVWLSSQRRSISTKPPVRSPREIAAGAQPQLPQDQVASVGETQQPNTHVPETGSPQAGSQPPGPQHSGPQTPGPQEPGQQTPGPQTPGPQEPGQQPPAE